MWEINNTTGYKASAIILREKEGAEILVIIVKATFEIEEDSSVKLAGEQVDPVLVPESRGDPATSSLIYDTDFVTTKPTTDVVLHGHAYSFHAKSQQRVKVTMSVGNIRKTLEVFGDRYWYKSIFGVKASPPETFEKIPLIYERAFGGRDYKSNPQKWDPRNPVGKGFATKRKHLFGQRLPNVEDPRNRRIPACFGPIGRHWSPRVELSGTCDQKWEEERLPLLPHDFQDRFYQAAPIDQQPTTHLRGGELVELINLTPSGLLRFRLPRVCLVFTTNIEGKIYDHHARLHTLAFEPDIRRILMTWQTSLPCHNRTYKIRRINIGEKPFIEHKE